MEQQLNKQDPIGIFSVLSILLQPTKKKNLSHTNEFVRNLGKGT
jgi:hypothetical protein